MKFQTNPSLFVVKSLNHAKSEYVIVCAYYMLSENNLIRPQIMGWGGRGAETFCVHIIPRRPRYSHHKYDFNLPSVRRLSAQRARTLIIVAVGRSIARAFPWSCAMSSRLCLCVRELAQMYALPQITITLDCTRDVVVSRSITPPPSPPLPPPPLTTTTTTTSLAFMILYV